MAAPTPFIGLKTIDRSMEADTTLVSKWIDDVNGYSNGNMNLIDSAFQKIVKEGTAFITTVRGNGINTEFEVKHDKNNLSPNVVVFSTISNNRILPEIKVIDKNTVKIIFLFPINNGEVYNVSIN